MPLTVEEAQLTGQANEQAENNLSSVKISRNSKGVTWEVKAKHLDAMKAMDIACDIEKILQERYK